MQTISTGMPRLCVSVFSPSGSTMSSSSPDVGARRGEDGVASSGSVYSWKALTTEENKNESKFNAVGLVKFKKTLISVENDYSQCKRLMLQ